MNTHTFSFDYTGDAESDIKAFFKRSEIINYKINFNYEWPRVVLTLKAHNAYKKFASFYLRKLMLNVSDDDISEIKFYEINN